MILTNPNLEIRNPKQILNTNAQMFKTKVRVVTDDAS